VKTNPSEDLTEQMSLKDTIVYNKLEVDNWEWEANTPSLLDTKHLQVTLSEGRWSGRTDPAT